MERYEQREQIKANIDYDYLSRQCPYDDVESLLELIVDVVSSIGYMLCRRFGVDCKAPQTGEVARLYEGYEPTDRGEALEALRKAARNMGDGIERSIQPRQQERGRHRQGIR